MKSVDGKFLDFSRANFGAYFEPNFNSFEAHPWEKSTTAEMSKFGLLIFFYISLGTFDALYSDF